MRFIRLLGIVGISVLSASCIYVKKDAVQSVAPTTDLDSFAAALAGYPFPVVDCADATFCIQTTVGNAGSFAQTISLVRPEGMPRGFFGVVDPSDFLTVTRNGVAIRSVDSFEADTTRVELMLSPNADNLAQSAGTHTAFIAMRAADNSITIAASIVYQISAVSGGNANSSIDACPDADPKPTEQSHVYYMAEGATDNCNNTYYNLGNASDRQAVCGSTPLSECDPRDFNPPANRTCSRVSGNTAQGAANARLNQRPSSPDWWLFKKGDRFTTGLTVKRGGASSDNPFVIGSYGPGTEKPHINNILVPYLVASNSGWSHLVVSGIKFAHDNWQSGSGTWGFSVSARYTDIHLEYNDFSHMRGGVLFENANPADYPVTNQTGIKVCRNILHEFLSNTSAHFVAGGGVYGKPRNIEVIGNYFFDSGLFANHDTLGAPFLPGHHIYFRPNNASSDAEYQSYYTHLRNNFMFKAASHAIMARSGGWIEDNHVHSTALGILSGTDYGRLNSTQVEKNIVLNGVDYPDFASFNHLGGSGTRGWAYNVQHMGDWAPNGFRQNIAANFPEAGQPKGLTVHLEVGNVSIEDNKFYNLRGTSVVFAGTQVHNVTFNDNELNNSLNSAALLGHYNGFSGSNVSAAGNTFFSAGSASNWFDVGSGTFLSWLNSLGNNGGGNTAASAPLNYVDPNRDAVRYFNEVLGIPVADYMAIRDHVVQNQRRGNWDANLEASAVNAWIRSGFSPGP